jgi:predicted dehydrogenase
MTLRFALIGTGFWSHYQLSGWRELEDVECVALCNRTLAKAEVLAAEFSVPAVYDDPEEMLRLVYVALRDRNWGTVPGGLMDPYAVWTLTCRGASNND